MKITNWNCGNCKVQFWVSTTVTPIRCPACEFGFNWEELDKREWMKHPLYLWAAKKTENNL